MHDPSHAPAHPHEHQHPTLGVLFIVFAALMVLLVVTVAVAQIELGRLNFLVAVLIASVKAVLIALYFMHLKYSLRLMWAFAAASLLWLMLLIGLTMTDYYTRSWPGGQTSPTETHAPPGLTRQPLRER
jgi:cytochrome c oxidase subunit IV